MNSSKKAFKINSEPARLDVDGVNVVLGGKVVLDNITFQTPHGERVAVVGPNGAGKSTLFKALVGLLPISSGQIYIHGLPLGQHQDCVAYVPQKEEIDWRFPVTVRDVVMMGRYGQLPRLRQPRKIDFEVVENCLDQLRIADLARKSIYELSGGQQQRVFIARALAQEPHLLLMDEPFAGVDMTTQEVTLGLLEELSARQVTVLVSTHDLNLATKRFEHVLLLSRRVVAYGSAKTIFTPNVLKEAFGGQVLLIDGAIVVDQCCGSESHVHDLTNRQS